MPPGCLRRPWSHRADGRHRVPQGAPGRGHHPGALAVRPLPALRIRRPVPVRGRLPLAERRAAALSLDSRLLAELLGQAELRELLDADVWPNWSGSSSGSPRTAGSRTPKASPTCCACSARSRKSSWPSAAPRRSGPTSWPPRAAPSASGSPGPTTGPGSRTRAGCVTHSVRPCPSVSRRPSPSRSRTRSATSSRGTRAPTARSRRRRPPPASGSARPSRTAPCIGSPRLDASYKGSSTRRASVRSGVTRRSCADCGAVRSRRCAMSWSRCRPPHWRSSCRSGSTSAAGTGCAASTDWCAPSSSCRARPFPRPRWRSWSCRPGSPVTPPRCSTSSPPPERWSGPGPGHCRARTAGSRCTWRTRLRCSCPPRTPGDHRAPRIHPGRPLRRLRPLLPPDRRPDPRDHASRRHRPSTRRRGLGPGLVRTAHERHARAHALPAGFGPHRRVHGPPRQALDPTRPLRLPDRRRAPPVPYRPADRGRPLVPAPRPRTRPHGARPRPRPHPARPARRGDPGRGRRGGCRGRLLRGLPHPVRLRGQRPGTAWIRGRRTRRGPVRDGRRGRPPARGSERPGPRRSPVRTGPLERFPRPVRLPRHPRPGEHPGLPQRPRPDGPAQLPRRPQPSPRSRRPRRLPRPGELRPSKLRLPAHQRPHRRPQLLRRCG